MPTSSLHNRSASAAASGNAFSDRSSKRRSLLPHLSRITPVNELENVDNQDDGMSVRSDMSSGRTSQQAGEVERQRSQMRPPAVRARGSSIREPVRTAATPDLGVRARGTSIAENAPHQLRSPTKLDRTPSIRKPTTTVSSGLPRSTSVQTTRPHARSGSVLDAPLRRGSVLESKHARSGSVLESALRQARPTSRGVASNTEKVELSPTKSVRSRIPATSKTSDEDSQAEPNLQQIELFQLSLLHQAAITTTKSFHESASTRLMQKYLRLRQSLGSVLKQEQERAKMANLNALLDWQPLQSELTDSLHVVQRVYQEADAMTQAGSAYGQIIVDFHIWMEEAMECAAGQQKKKFVQTLPDKWRHAHASAALSVRSMQRELAALPPSLPPSSLASIIKSCESLLDGMLRELDIMMLIEKTLLRIDRKRINQAVASIRQLQIDASQEWKPAWH